MQLFRTDKRLTPSWDLVKPSFKMLQDNIWQVFYLSFLPALLMVVGMVLAGNLFNLDQLLANNLSMAGTPREATEFTGDGRSWAGLGLVAISIIWTLLAYPGLLYLQSQAIQGKQVGAMEAFKAGLSRLLPIIGMSIVGGLLIFLGLIAFIIPGLILIRGFYLAPYYVIDQNMGPIEALKASFRDSKPAAGWIWGVIGVEIVFSFFASFVGGIPVIGYLLSLAVGLIYLFAPAMRYGEVAKDIKVPAVVVTDL